nr:fibropellin-3-like; partial [Biomphalaria glabrata]
MDIKRYNFLWIVVCILHQCQAGESETSARQLQQLKAVGVCTRAPCLNAGSCSVHAQSSSYTCQCLPGFTGQNCELGIDECASSPCLNGACVDNIGSFRCMCFPGYKGRLCEIEIDLCASSPCHNDGRCVQTGPGNIQCECRPGYRGSRCEMDIDECLSLSPCQHGGSCTQGPPGTYICACREGYTGFDCEKAVNICDSNHCLNGGQCTPDETVARFHCQCRPGYQGATCSQVADACVNNPCRQGTCRTIEPGTFVCDDCDVPGCQGVGDPCASRPCQNNGTCVPDSQGSFSCVCLEHFTGLYCEAGQQSCGMVVCYNGGTCQINSDGSNKCKCTEGFSGDRCDVSTDPCLSQPCHNNGTCEVSRSTQGFHCQCLPQYSGLSCQFVNLTSNSTNEISRNGLIIFSGRLNPTVLFSILGILLALGTIIGVSGIILRKRHIHRPQDFCFSLPSSFYQQFPPAGSSASSGRFQNGSILDYDEFLHTPSAFRY